jgi:AP-1 complex subunit sigma 1/2
MKVNQLVITRNPKMCNFLEYKEYKIVYKRFASLYFITIVDKDENELIVLELMQSFVEILDKYFGNVCELDLIFNFHQVSLHLLRHTSSSMN